MNTSALTVLSISVFLNNLAKVYALLYAVQKNTKKYKNKRAVLGVVDLFVVPLPFYVYTSYVVFTYIMQFLDWATNRGADEERLVAFYHLADGLANGYCTLHESVASVLLLML